MTLCDKFLLACVAWIVCGLLIILSNHSGRTTTTTTKIDAPTTVTLEME